MVLLWSYRFIEVKVLKMVLPAVVHGAAANTVIQFSHTQSFFFCFVFFFFRKPSKKKRKSTKNEEEQANDLPPITFKGGRKGFNLSESLRGYHSFTDEEESEQRRKNDQRGLPNFNRKGSYQRLSGEKDVELEDGTLEDSPEKDRKKSGKKKRRRSKGNDDDVVS